MNSINRIIEVESVEDQAALEDAHEDVTEMDMAVLQMLLARAFDRDFYNVNKLDIETVDADRSIDLEIVSGSGSCEVEDKSGKSRVQITYEINADEPVGEAEYDAVEVVIEPM